MKALIVICSAGLLAGCSTTVSKPGPFLASGNPTPATQISAGMSKSEVTAVMGNPSGMKTSVYRSEHFCHAYSYSAGAIVKYLWVEYDNDVVVGYQDGQNMSACYFPDTAADMKKHSKELIQAAGK